MVCCKICGRKQSAKRVLNELKICCVCDKKIKEFNYELVNISKDIINSTIDDNANSTNAPDIITHEINIQDVVKQLKNLTAQVNYLTEQMKYKPAEPKSTSQIKANANNSSQPKVIREKSQPPRPFFYASDVNNEDDSYTYSDDVNIMTGSDGNRVGKTRGIRADVPDKRPAIVNKENPEQEQYFKKTVPGSSTYRDVAKQGKKTCIIGGSIIKRIDMKEFNYYLENGKAIKRSFPGATASQINYYIEEVLNEETPDKMLINIGTNNLTHKDQTEEETAKEIWTIVNKCHEYGVNHIFVSGLTCRPTYQRNIDEINKLLYNNAGRYGYTFIDNSDIERRHLWKDQLHLNDQGTINLACNFLDSLNKSVYEIFY